MVDKRFHLNSFLLVYTISLLPDLTKPQPMEETTNAYDFVSADYNRQLRPYEGGVTDIVDIGMFVNSVRTISENDMTVILDVFLQAEWSDHRLNWTWGTFYRDHIRHNMPGHCMSEECFLKEITLGKDFANAIWRPDFYLPDAIHIIPADDYNDNVCVRLRPDFSLFYSNRLIITISCIMKLVYFPFDKHVCPICIGSYKYHDGLLRMKWSDDLSGMYQDQFTANFFMEGYAGVEDYYNVSMLYLNDMFTEHCFNITIHRKYNIFLVTLYLPSVSLVALSWVNFWIDHKAIPARAGLSITAILAQITLIVGMASRFPSVSDLKMADLYLTVNFIYTFATLIEFAIVSYNPEEKRQPASSSSASHPVAPPPLPPTGPTSAPSNPPTPTTVAKTTMYMPINTEDIVMNKDLLRNGSTLGPGLGGPQTMGSSATHLPGSSSTSTPLPKPRNEYIRLRRPDAHIGELSAITPSLRPARHHPSGGKKLKRKKNTNLDDVSKFVFPITFIVWNFIFFTVNLVLAEKYCIILKYFAQDYCESSCPLC